ncbi:hypothetical protein CRI94_14180 [Longibacter salinarum]|uniref:Uncharacterized protein n=1 Tax=Longibacter salinarum TaxID=1850348 RepID=A0A2A8CW85_9BACT|nr:hypothetical protein [Longibacter salinarum]PEN12658.1 hypothetical protein CRI94_14180 [Longibacter salinarum]
MIDTQPRFRPDESHHSPSPERSSLRIAEDGETLGTIQSLARYLNVTRTAIEQCATRSRSAIVLPRSEGADPVIILPDGLGSLSACTSALDAATTE